MCPNRIYWDHLPRYARKEFTNKETNSQEKNIFKFWKKKMLSIDNQKSKGERERIEELIYMIHINMIDYRILQSNTHV